MNYIMKSKGKNWSGKEFSEYPAKIYTSVHDCADAIENYHLWELNHELDKFVEVEKLDVIQIIPLNDKKTETLLSQEKIRW